MAKTSGGHTLTPIDSRFVAQNIGIFQVQGSNFSFLSCSSLPFFFSSSSSDFNLDPNTVSIHHTLNLLKTCQNMAQLFQIQARLLTSALFQNPSFAGRILKLSTDFEDCKLECLKSCNCTGYASASINVGGRGCYAWYGELNDIRTYVDGQDFYIRVDALELDNYKRNNSNSTSGRKRMKAIIIILTVISGVLLLFCCSLYARRKHVLRKDDKDLFTFRNIRYHYNVADTRLQQHVEKGNEDGLYISCVASAANLWALIMDAGTSFCSQVYELSAIFLHKELLTPSNLTKLYKLCSPQVYRKSMEKNEKVITEFVEKETTSNEPNYRGIKAMAFIVGNEAFEKLGTIGTSSNFLVYLTSIF